jgi:DNA gyrase subunit B
MRVESARDGSIWAQEYQRGKPTGPVKKIGPAGHPPRDDHELHRRHEMFETTEYSFDIISQRSASRRT